MRDFTISVYRELLKELGGTGYEFQAFREFVENPADRAIILRHDVDARKRNALQFARIQYEMGIAGTYYFRLAPKSYDEKLIKEIAGMGHEIGYHYEAVVAAKGNKKLALQMFEEGLGLLRRVADIKTICMHGSPLSKYDNRSLWQHYHYRDYGIIGEPYFDLDFSTVLYLTDTGRRWDGENVSLRDRSADASINKNMTGKKPLSDQFSFRSTYDIITACNEGGLPDKIMFNFHPQRWTDHPLLWTRELVLQNVKNVAKGVLRGWRGGGGDGEMERWREGERE